MEKNITCIYHKDCIDGTTAAAVILAKYPNAQTFSLAHGYAPDEIDTILDLTPHDSDVFIVDTTVGLLEFLARDFKVTVIDHHVSEHARLLEIAGKHTNLTYVYDVEKSGASLTWSYLFKDVPTSKLILHVEDRDLWKHAYGESTEHVANYLSLHNNNPRAVVELIQTPIETIVEKGSVLTEYVHMQVGKYVLMGPLTLKIGTHDVLAYNITDHQSACGNALGKENDTAVALYTIIGDSVKFSFRSPEHAEPSALKLAMTLGGGGHRNASGAKIPFHTFLDMIVR